MTKFRAIPSDLQSRKPVVDPEQAKAEREKRKEKREKRKEKREYNSCLPNFRRSFVTAHCWMLEQLKKEGEQKTKPYNYSVVSKRHAERR